MSVNQTEGKITALYERLSRDDDNAGDSNSIVNQKNTSKAMPHREATRTVSIIRTTDGAAAILSALLGKSWWRILKPEKWLTSL